MLYFPFKDSLERLNSAMAGIYKYGIPDYDEKPSQEISDFLSDLEFRISILTKVVENLPPELEGYPNKNFGPVVNVSDIEKILWLSLPFAERLNDRCPVVSHFPIELYRDKCLVIVEVMNLYCAWKSYLLTPQKRIFQTACSFISFEKLEINLEATPIYDNKLEILFKNISNSSRFAQQEIEKEFGESYKDI